MYFLKMALLVRYKSIYRHCLSGWMEGSDQKDHKSGREGKQSVRAIMKRSTQPVRDDT